MTQRDTQPETPVCPGWGEPCGNETAETADLCPYCHMARLDTESPRIPLWPRGWGRRNRPARPSPRHRHLSR